MEIFVCRKTSKAGNEYLVIEARADWGKVPMTFDKSAILELLPYGLDHRTIDQKGIEIGKLNEEYVPY